MKKHALVLTLMLFSPFTFSAGDVEESPPAYGCAGCSNNQSVWDEYNRQQMNSAAAYAEAQRAMQAQVEAQLQLIESGPMNLIKNDGNKKLVNSVCRMPLIIKRAVLRMRILPLNHTMEHAVGWLPEVQVQQLLEHIFLFHRLDGQLQ